MTDMHKEMCGCEDCIIPKQMLQTFKAWTGLYLKELNEEESKVDGALIDSLKSFVMADDKPRFEHPCDMVDLMTCQPATEGRLPNIKCCLGCCQECPSFDFPALLMDDTANARRLSYQDYQYHSY